MLHIMIVEDDKNTARLMDLVLRRAGRLQLMDEIWGMDSDTIPTTVNVHITRLRRRFGAWPEFSLVAVRGIGYKAVIHVE